MPEYPFLEEDVITFTNTELDSTEIISSSDGDSEVEAAEAKAEVYPTHPR